MLALVVGRRRLVGKQPSQNAKGNHACSSSASSSSSSSVAPHYAKSFVPVSPSVPVASEVTALRGTFLHFDDMG